MLLVQPPCNDKDKKMLLHEDWCLLVSPSARELKGVSRREMNNVANQSHPPPPIPNKVSASSNIRIFQQPPVSVCYQ